MIEITVLYPNTPGAQFNYEYYMQTHFPMVERKLGSALKGYDVKRGVAGLQPGTPPANLYVAHLCFDSVEAFYAAFTPIANDLVSDIVNYTNIAPIIQISEPAAKK
jgi:uncharacterized protein (TIGR02118 family)